MRILFLSENLVKNEIQKSERRGGEEVDAELDHLSQVFSKTHSDSGILIT